MDYDGTRAYDNDCYTVNCNKCQTLRFLFENVFFFCDNFIHLYNTLARITAFPSFIPVHSLWNPSVQHAPSSFHVFLLSETESHCLSLAGLELTMCPMT